MVVPMGAWKRLAISASGNKFCKLQLIPKFGNKFHKWYASGLPLAIFCQWQATAQFNVEICGFCTEWRQFGRKLLLASHWQIFAKSLPNPMASASSSGSP
jgi:hypothetical protein